MRSPFCFVTSVAVVGVRDAAGDAVRVAMLPPSMTSDTLCGRASIGADGLAIGLLDGLVTLRASDIAMRYVERKTRPVVGETGGTPMLRVVASRTIFQAIRLAELAAVGVVLGMAGEALIRRLGKIGLAGCDGRLVARDAFCFLVRAGQSETCAGMVEWPGVGPAGRDVARLAGLSRLVRIGMTGVTGLRRELELLPGRAARDGLVTVGASGGGMMARQRKSRLRVPFESERGRPVSFYRVAELALIPVARLELAAVPIDMARSAGRLSGAVDRVAPCRDMALGAVDRCVLTFQRKSGLAMGLTIEARGFEPGDGVTGRAVGARGSCRELTAVRIGVAILAEVVCDGAMKIAGLVAIDAGLFRVFAR